LLRHVIGKRKQMYFIWRRKKNKTNLRSCNTSVWKQWKRRYHLEHWCHLEKYILKINQKKIVMMLSCFLATTWKPIHGLTWKEFQKIDVNITAEMHVHAWPGI
jgi:hypothetical protein